MRGYQLKADRRTSGSADQRGEAHVAARAGADAGPANGASDKCASLLQLQRALDQSPKVQSQVALQRALDERTAGGKAPQKKKPAREKPALQMKGIAINDDAGLEREADAMGARASAAPARRWGAWAATIQRGKNKKKATPDVAGPQGEMKDLYANTINRHLTNKRLQTGLSFETLGHVIRALEGSIPLRKEVNKRFGGGDAGHKERLDIEIQALADAQDYRRTAPKEADRIVPTKPPETEEAKAKKAKDLADAAKRNEKNKKKKKNKKKNQAVKAEQAKHADTKQAEADTDDFEEETDAEEVEQVEQAEKDTKSTSVSASASAGGADAKGGDAKGVHKKKADID